MTGVLDLRELYAFSSQIMQVVFDQENGNQRDVNIMLSEFTWVKLKTTFCTQMPTSDYSLQALNSAVHTSEGNINLQQYSGRGS